MNKIKRICHDHREELFTIKMYLLVVTVLAMFAHMATQ